MTLAERNVWTWRIGPNYRQEKPEETPWIYDKYRSNIGSFFGTGVLGDFHPTVSAPAGTILNGLGRNGGNQRRNTDKILDDAII